jgi:predicted nucleic-acid-binding Zn-ribbon protein
MNKYNPDRPCLKCGSVHHEVRYSEHRDRMVVKCKTCEYTWTELPCDARESEQ